MGMDIMIDSREKDRKLRAADYYAKKGHNSTIKSLDVGDYVFNEQVVFEYKEISDFIQSINNDSLFNESTNQALVYPYHYVIIVGNIRDYVSGGWSYARKYWRNNYAKYIQSIFSRYYGALRRLRTFTCPIIVETEEEAFQEMLLQAIKCLDGKTKYYTNVTRQPDCQDAIDVLLTSAKNISIKKAEAIRKMYDIKNIYDLLELSEADFTMIHGIGKTTSTNLYEFLHSGDA